MGRDKDKPDTGKKAMEAIQLNDLLPRQNVKGGSGKPRVIFGSVNSGKRKQRPGSEL